LFFGNLLLPFHWNSLSAFSGVFMPTRRMLAPAPRTLGVATEVEEEEVESLAPASSACSSSSSSRIWRRSSARLALICARARALASPVRPAFLTESRLTPAPTRKGRLSSDAASMAASAAASRRAACPPSMASPTLSSSDQKSSCHSLVEAACLARTAIRAFSNFALRMITSRMASSRDLYSAESGLYKSYEA